MILSLSLLLAHAHTHNNAFCCVFANSYKKTANGDRYAMLKVIQHGVMIAKYGSGRPAWLGIDDKIASIGRDDY
jgi:hypothetical protein